MDIVIADCYSVRSVLGRKTSLLKPTCREFPAALWILSKDTVHHILGRQIIQNVLRNYLAHVAQLLTRKQHNAALWSGEWV